MQSIPLDAIEHVAEQLTLLNVMLLVYLVCKGAAFVGSVLQRRDPPKKLIRSKLAQANES